MKHIFLKDAHALLFFIAIGCVTALGIDIHDTLGDETPPVPFDPPKKVLSNQYKTSNNYFQMTPYLTSYHQSESNSQTLLLSAGPNFHFSDEMKLGIEMGGSITKDENGPNSLFY